MAISEQEAGRKSLGEVHGSVGVTHQNPFKRLFAFLGPAYLVSVGYMDPGNWATDLEGGAKFGYALLWVLLMSNVMAVILQTLSARLGVVTGHDLAQACRAEYSRRVNFALWALAEVAIAACDLAEVVGTVIALKLLFGLPLLWGCVVDGVRHVPAALAPAVRDEEDGSRDPGAGRDDRRLLPDPDPDGPARRLGRLVLRGFRPTLPPGSLFVAIGILGATVMPHNLYLHSALVQSRRIGKDRASKAKACKYNLIDSALALNVAFFVNARS